MGIDLAERLLDVARATAKVHGLENVEFRVGDMLDLGLPKSRFDAVVCVFGIFFVPDMTPVVRELWKVVRPGGKLAITTWGPRFFEPGNTAFFGNQFRKRNLRNMRELPEFAKQVVLFEKRRLN